MSKCSNSRQTFLWLSITFLFQLCPIRTQHPVVTNQYKVKFQLTFNSIQNFRSLPNICKDKPVIKHAWKASDEDEEKFQREILSEEPNLIKLYLQQRGDRNSWNGTSRGDMYESSEASYSEEVFSNKVIDTVLQRYSSNMTLILSILRMCLL